MELVFALQPRTIVVVYKQIWCFIYIAKISLLFFLLFWSDRRWPQPQVSCNETMNIWAQYWRSRVCCRRDWACSDRPATATLSRQLLYKVTQDQGTETALHFSPVIYSAPPKSPIVFDRTFKYLLLFSYWILKRSYLFGSKCWAAIGDNSRFILSRPSLGRVSLGFTNSDEHCAETLN